MTIHFTRKLLSIISFFILSIAVQPAFVNAQTGKSVLSFDASMGTSMLHGPLSDSGFPFGLAENGLYLSIAAHYLLVNNAGISLHFSNALHPYDINAAANYLLEQDPYAFSLMVRSGDYSISVLTGGLFYNVVLAPQWSVQITARAGAAIVQTPRIVADLMTEPNTILRYGIGRTSAFAGSVGIQPRYHLNERLNVQLSINWSAANPVISGSDQQSRTFSYGIGFQQWQVGAGIVYHIQKKAKTQL